MENELDYITQMVEDTFENLENNENVLTFPLDDTNESHTLSSKEANESSEQLSFDFESIRGHYDQKRACLCLDISGQHIEIPVSWGPFKLYNFSEENFSIFLEKYDDVDLLLDVFASILNIDIENMKIDIDQGEVLLTFNNADVHHLAA